MGVDADPFITTCWVLSVRKLSKIYISYKNIVGNTEETLELMKTARNIQLVYITSCLSAPYFFFGDKPGGNVPYTA